MNIDINIVIYHSQTIWGMDSRFHGNYIKECGNDLLAHVGHIMTEYVTMNILFFQSTILGGYHDELGLTELFISQLKQCQQAELELLQQNVPLTNLFQPVEIIVPNNTLATWLKDRIAEKSGIAANLKFRHLIGPLLEHLYLINNQPTSTKATVKLFDFAQAKFILYDYLCNNRLNIPSNHELHQYLYQNEQLDKYRSFQLACTLADIFEEYIYLRTEELLKLTTCSIANWQKQLLQHLFDYIMQQKQVSFLDIYSYFTQSELDIDALILPPQIFIFGLSRIYPAQLQILKKLATKLNIYWYYHTPSYEYYGDLLTIRVKNILAQKALHAQDFSLDDLYLNDGNVLLANLAQQSREFIELLHMHDINVYNFKLPKSSESSVDGNNPSLLKIIQEDIKNIKQRTSATYRMTQDNTYYAEPIALKAPYDQSFKINSCYNRMREVQVMFNEIADFLVNNPDIPLHEILICAPRIEDYAPYIEAVFSNEVVQNIDGEQYKIPCGINTNVSLQQYQILEVLQFILATPYHLPVSYFIEIITQSTLQKNLALSMNDIERIKVWLKDNHVNFGYSADDYSVYGYHDYAAHSFEYWLNNLVLGATVSQQGILNSNHFPTYTDGDEKHLFCPYDNLDSAQIDLCNILLNVIQQLKQLRNNFYLNATTYRELTITQIKELLTIVFANLVSDNQDKDICTGFLASLNTHAANETVITLAILQDLLSNYLQLVKGKVRVAFTGTIMCGSMNEVQNLPFSYIYVLGLNFAEFPISYQPNQLSMLAVKWHLADRNYNLEDKQTFLNILLSAKQQLCLSYVGRKETDNSIIKPSSIVTMLISTLEHSFSNFTEFSKYIIVQQALHPIKSVQKNYSPLWYQLAQALSSSNSRVKANGGTYNLRWDFSQISPFKLTKTQQDRYYKPTLKDITHTFLYTNTNLLKVLNINQYSYELQFSDNEDLTIRTRALGKQVYNYFSRYLTDASMVEDKIYQKQLQEYLIAQGVLGYQNIAKIQFDYYLSLYQIYCKLRGKQQEQINYVHAINNGDEAITLTIDDTVWIDDDAIIIIDEFANIQNKTPATTIDEIPYELQIRALISHLLLVNGAISNHNIKRVVIHSIANNGSFNSFAVTITSNNIANLFNSILRYYLRSLTNPVLIHRAAIEKYASLLRVQVRGRGEINEDLLNQVEQVYTGNYANYELERLKTDIIFGEGNIAEEYFSIMQNNRSVNDILIIGKILAELGIKSS